MSSEGIPNICCCLTKVLAQVLQGAAKVRLPEAKKVNLVDRAKAVKKAQISQNTLLNLNSQMSDLQSPAKKARNQATMKARRATTTHRKAPHFLRKCKSASLQNTSPL
jgi:hypothetical protein